MTNRVPKLTNPGEDRLSRRGPFRFDRAHVVGASLVGTLTAVAIIGILIALLIPTLMRYKEKSLVIRCMSNLRNIGIAINLYAGENDDRMPGPEFGIVNMRGNLVLALNPYLNDSVPVWKCPANPTVYPEFSNYLTHTPLFGYYYAPPKQTLDPPKRSLIIRDYSPEKRWIMEDIDAWNYGPQDRLGKGKEGPVHGTARNRLFLDAHVELQPAISP
jgi:type II secretory pathway pseudopilin PulG